MQRLAMCMVVDSRFNVDGYQVSYASPEVAASNSGRMRKVDERRKEDCVPPGPLCIFPLERKCYTVRNRAQTVSLATISRSGLLSFLSFVGEAARRRLQVSVAASKN